MAGAIAARGLFDAVGLLAKHFWLVVTNPPFLGQGEYNVDLLHLLKQGYSNAKGDLCTAMLTKMLDLTREGGTVAAVTKQEWCFLPTFVKFRSELLKKHEFNFFAFLGEEAWDAFGDRGPKTILVSIKAKRPNSNSGHFIVDTTPVHDRIKKGPYLANGDISLSLQDEQKKNPKSRISAAGHATGVSLSQYATCHNGVVTGDSERFSRAFWELPRIDHPWILQCSGGIEDKLYSGMSKCIRWDDEFHSFIDERLDGNAGAWIRGTEAWGLSGIVISGMRYLHRGIYVGTAFDNNCSVIIPKNKADFSAIWHFCSNEAYYDAVRSLNPKVSVTDDTFIQVPFDIGFWRREAAQMGPIPEPYSDDPTQWLFHGHPAYSENGTQLHVVLARLAGFQWPIEYRRDIKVSPLAREHVDLASKLPAADTTGILPLHATAQNRALADRIREYLAVAFGSTLTPAQESDLVRATDLKFDKREGRSSKLEDWLRDRAFRQHCLLFSNKNGHGRPFVWQVWDSLPDGFSAFINYHRLSYAVLEKLAFSVLGDWIATASNEGLTAHQGCALQLQQRLRTILNGDAPHDIFVRWKSLVEQPDGWQPDTNDGIRVNIRPFVISGVLRDQMRINWNKDRGTDVASAPWRHLGSAHGGKEGDRINDHHLTLAEKRAARAKAS